MGVPERVLKMRADWAASDAKRDEGLVEPEDVTAYKDIVYATRGEEELRLDIYIPGNADVVLPTIINVHGGGYFYGDKELYRFYCMDLARRGYAVVNFDYRLSPEHIFPDALNDINAVCEWVMINGSDYKCDTGNVCMIGDSAGAQLTAHYATIQSNDKYADLIGIHKPEGFSLRAISLACGMYDLVARGKSERDKQLIRDYLGENTGLDDPRLRYLDYINSDYPPAYLFTAVYDFLNDQCEPMFNLLLDRGVNAEMAVYGKEEDAYMMHVFHVDMKLTESTVANDDQIDFFWRISNV